MTLPGPPEPTHIRDITGLSLSISLGNFQSDLLYWGEVMPGTWRTAWHAHSFVEVCYAFAGRGAFRIQGREHVVQATDMFVARPDEAHQIVSSGDDALGIRFWAFTLARTAELGCKVDSIDELLDAFLASPIAIRRCAPPVPMTLDLLAGEAARHEAGYAQAIQGLAGKLLIDSCRTVTDIPPALEPTNVMGHGTADSIARTIIRYLQDNCGRAIALRDIAAHVYLSERQTSRLFRRVTGRSPMRYLTSVRLHRAEQLLLSGTLSIKDVAEHCGYPDVQYFSTWFHRHTGLPPGRFRDQGGTRFLAAQPEQNIRT